MPSFCHIRKHGEWTSEEKEICLKALKEAETRLKKRRVDEGLILENVVVPLPDKKHLCKYRSFEVEETVGAISNNQPLQFEGV